MIHYQPFYLCRSHGYGLRSDLITKVHFVRKHPTCLEPKGAETNGCLICFRVCSKGFHAIKPEKSAPKHVPTLLCPHSKRYQLTHVFVIRKVLVSAFVWVHQCSSWYLEPYTPWFNRPLSCFFVSRLDLHLCYIVPTVIIFFFIPMVCVEQIWHDNLVHVGGTRCSRVSALVAKGH